MTLPLSLMGKYQLVVLGSEGDPQVSDYASRLNTALHLAFNHLGVNTKKFLVRVMSGTSAPDMDRKMPSVAVFFGFVLYKVIQIRRKKPSIGVFAGETAVTIDRLTPETQGYVRYKGEYWLASAKVEIEPNTKVLIVRKEDQVLHVQPVKSPKS